MLPHLPAAIVFDMDGLLFDTEALYQEAILLAAAEGGHDVTSGIFSRTLGLPWLQTRSLLLGHFGNAFSSPREGSTRWIGGGMPRCSGFAFTQIATGDLDIAVVGQLPAANLPLGDQFERVR